MHMLLTWQKSVPFRQYLSYTIMKKGYHETIYISTKNNFINIFCSHSWRKTKKYTFLPCHEKEKTSS